MQLILSGLHLDFVLANMLWGHLKILGLSLGLSWLAISSGLHTFLVWFYQQSYDTLNLLIPVNIVSPYREPPYRTVPDILSDVDLFHISYFCSFNTSNTLIDLRGSLSLISLWKIPLKLFVLEWVFWQKLWSIFHDVRLVTRCLLLFTYPTHNSFNFFSQIYLSHSFRSFSYTTEETLRIKKYIKNSTPQKYFLYRTEAQFNCVGIWTFVRCWEPSIAVKSHYCLIGSLLSLPFHPTAPIPTSLFFVPCWVFVRSSWI